MPKLAKQRGFSLSEIIIAMGVIALLGATLVPKMVVGKASGQANITIKEIFAIIGEAYLARKNDESLIAAGQGENLSGNATEQARIFARYLNDHLNATRSNFNAAANFDPCQQNSLFTMRGGAIIRNVCVRSTGVIMDISVPAERSNSFVSFSVVVPKDGTSNRTQDRYTTGYGSGLTGCSRVDKLFNIVDNCNGLTACSGNACMVNTTANNSNNNNNTPGGGQSNPGTGQGQATSQN